MKLAKIRIIKITTVISIRVKPEVRGRRSEVGDLPKR